MPQFTDYHTPLPCGCSLKDGRCPEHSGMMRVIHETYYGPDHATADAVYAESDGYGIQGFVPEQGHDWSGIRDSSTEAIERMFAVATRGAVPA